MHSETLDRARAGDAEAFAALVAPFRRELRAHCYRMSGSLVDADDLLQDSLVRAWRGLAGFEGRSSLRTWLYRVTTHACLDGLERRSARVLPGELATDVPDLEQAWLGPCPEDLWADPPPTPDARYDARESVALAFLVALQRLPPKQRAVLILRDVLGWQAAECADLLDLSVAAVNGALQRARESVHARAAASASSDDPAIAELVARYVRAWEAADVDALVALLREDATVSMPPLSSWFRGASVIGDALRGMVLPPGSAGRFRVVPTQANGAPAFAVYALDPASGAHVAAAIHVLEVREGRITDLVAFLEPSLFPAFGLPATRL
jgi:RNA polymerase sigma-70 factor (ECF subfamily)